MYFICLCAVYVHYCIVPRLGTTVLLSNGGDSVGFDFQKMNKIALRLDTGCVVKTFCPFLRLLQGLIMTCKNLQDLSVVVRTKQWCGNIIQRYLCYVV